MTFLWGMNLLRHFPMEVPLQRDVIFLGSYVEKTQRIDRYFGPVFARHSATIMGVGWGDSPFDITDSMLQDFNAAAPTYIRRIASVSIFTTTFRNAASAVTSGRLTRSRAGASRFPTRRIGDYFPPDEVVVAENEDDSADKVAHFVANPDERKPYMEKAQKRVFAGNTYHHRLADLVAFIYDSEPLSSDSPIIGEPD